MEEIRQYEWIAKYLSGELSDKELATFEQWLQEDREHQQLLEETRALWNESATYDDPIRVNQEKAWTTFEEKMDWQSEEAPPIKQEGKVLRLAAYRRIWQAAAMLLLVAGAFLWMTRASESGDDWMVVRASDNRTEQVELPDGSTVWLNENTQLSYAPDFKTNRQLILKGEAFFEVVRDETHPFSIASEQTRTTVLGTAFNIRAYPSETVVEVSVQSGKVSFAETIRNKQPLLLEKNESGILDKGAWKLAKSTTVERNRMAWRTKELNFQNTKMLDVARDLERFFGIEVAISNPLLHNCRFTGEFKVPKLDEVLQAVQFALDIESTQKGEHYMLSGEGCE